MACLYNSRFHSCKSEIIVLTIKIIFSMLYDVYNYTVLSKTFLMNRMMVFLLEIFSNYNAMLHSF